MPSRASRAAYNSFAFVSTLPSEVETALFRIVQESVTNISHHSESKDVRIDMALHRTISAVAQMKPAYRSAS
jgi:signal transduction histidine kinase